MMEDNDFFDDASASGASLTSGDEDEIFDVNNDDGAKNDNNNNNVVDDFNKTNAVDNETDEIDYNDGDFWTQYLKERGITNPDEIEITNDDGETVKVPFSELSNEDKFSVLKSSDVDLSDDEIETINFLRKNNTTLRDVLNYNEQSVRNKIMNELDSSRDFSVDDASDEELFVADMKTKYPTLTDDEL